MRAASVMRVSGASMRPARIHPPTRPNTSRNASAPAAEIAIERRRWERTSGPAGLIPTSGRSRRTTTPTMAHDTPFGSDEDFEHCELFPGERDVAAVAVDLAAERIQTQACDLSHRWSVVGAPAGEGSEAEAEVL